MRTPKHTFNTREITINMRRHELYKRGRSCPVTCLAFGQNRKEEYQDHFFCNACDLLEDAVLNSVRAKPNRQMQKYMCGGGHSDVSHPTTLKKMQHYRSKHQNEMPQTASGDDDSFCYASAVACGNSDKNEEKESPSKSPTKKKPRRQQDSMHSFNISNLEDEVGDDAPARLC